MYLLNLILKSKFKLYIKLNIKKGIYNHIFGQVTFVKTHPIPNFSTSTDVIGTSYKLNHLNHTVLY